MNQVRNLLYFIICVNANRRYEPDKFICGYLFNTQVYFLSSQINTF